MRPPIVSHRELVKRLEKSPTDTKKLIQLLKNQLTEGNILDQKRATESIILADEQSAPALLEIALNSGSDWVQETALRSCRVLSTPSEQILRAVRKRLLQHYLSLELFRDFSYYRVLFSSPMSFAPLLHYIWILDASSLVLVVLGTLFGLFCLITGGLFLFLLLCAIILATYWFIKTAAYPFIGERIRPRMQTTLLMAVLLTWLPTTVEVTSQFIIMVAISSAIIICQFIFVAYLASNYPTALSGWVLLPFKIVIHIPKRIVGAIKSSVRKRGWWSLIWSSAKITVIVGVALGVFIGFLYAWVKAIGAMSACESSLKCLYDAYHPVFATLIVFFVVGTLIAVLWQVPKFILVLWLMIRDLVLIRYLSLNPGARPVSAIEAVERLHAFTLDSVKVQYIRALRNWLPIPSEWHILLEEANRHTGAVRDELSKLAELWQDFGAGNT